MKRPSGPRPADTEHTPTHTHTVFTRPGITWTFPLSSPVFPLWSSEPQVPAAGSPGRRGFENHRPKTDHTYKTSPFSFFLRVLCTPNIRHTYTLSLSSLAITIAPYQSTLVCVCVFSITLSRIHGARTFGTQHPNSLSLLSFDSAELRLHDNP